MPERTRSLVDIMKDKINRSSSGFANIFYVRRDAKCRIRFLSDIDEGMELRFHSKWQKYNHLCLSYVGKDCPHCDQEEEGGVKYDMYAFTIWNYESKKREIFLYKASKNSPIFQLISFSEEYGTISDRDYVIKKQGEGVNTLYLVTPVGEAKRFRGDEKPFSKKMVIKLIAEAFPYEGDDELEDSDDDDDTPPWNDKKSKVKPKAKRRPAEDEDEDVDEDDEEEDERPARRSKPRKASRDEDEDEESDDEEEDEDDEPDYRTKVRRTREAAERRPAASRSRR